MHQLFNTRKILIDILTILGTEENVEVFADEFLSTCVEKAVLDSIDKAPIEQKEAMQNALRDVKSPEEIDTVIQQYLTPEAFFLSLQQASQTLLQDYVTTMASEISLEKKQKVAEYFEKVVKESTDEMTTVPDLQSAQA